MTNAIVYNVVIIWLMSNTVVLSANVIWLITDAVLLNDVIIWLMTNAVDFNAFVIWLRTNNAVSNAAVIWLMADTVVLNAIVVWLRTYTAVLNAVIIWLMTYTSILNAAATWLMTDTVVWCMTDTVVWQMQLILMLLLFDRCSQITEVVVCYLTTDVDVFNSVIVSQLTAPHEKNPYLQSQKIGDLKLNILWTLNSAAHYITMASVIQAVRLVDRALTSPLLLSLFHFYTDSGDVAVVHYQQRAAANYLCLSEEEKHDTLDISSNAHLYGVEYRVQGPHKLSAFCAVCSIASASKVEIIYSTECQPGWNKQYGGYQMKGVGAFNLSRATGYFCVDTKMDGRKMDPESDEEGGRLTFVGYIHLADNRCVVCSR